jgi:uncharacterized membrane protein
LTAEGGAAPALKTSQPRPLDLSPAVRWSVLAIAAVLTVLTSVALARLAFGMAPLGTHLRPVVAAHVLTVLPAIPLGAYLLFVRKGGTRHRWLGRLWLTLMAATAASTLFIRDINHGRLSWIHLFTLLTIVSIPRALLAARRREFAKHRSIMLSFYIGALIIAGYFTFVPGRLMWKLVFG